MKRPGAVGARLHTFPWMNEDGRRWPALLRTQAAGAEDRGQPAGVMKCLKLDWSIQNGAIQIMPRGGNNGDAPLPLSSTTGLIGAPARIFYTQGVGRRHIEGPWLAHAAQKETQIAASGYRVTSLLLPKATPGATIELDTKEVKGRFRIETVRHSGDTRGDDWDTDLEVIEP